MIVTGFSSYGLLFIKDLKSNFFFQGESINANQ